MNYIRIVEVIGECLLRITIGCNQDWVRLQLNEFIVIGIESNHIQEVIQPIIERKIILWNENKKLFRINIEYLILYLPKMGNFQIEKLNNLIGKSLSNRTSQNRNKKLPKKVNTKLLNEEKVVSQNRNSFTHGIASVKNILTNKYTNSDTNIFIADKSFKKTGIIDPTTFMPNSNNDYIALDAWRRLEPSKPNSFGFYLYAVSEVPLELIGQWVSEIEQDNNIKNKGAVFVNKVKEYLKKKKGVDTL